MEVALPTAGRERSGTGRLVLLDVLRGVAILGTLATNVWIFTHPAAEYGVLVDTGSVMTLSANPVETAFRFLANGKFLAMLTILFGVGLAIQHRSALRRGERWPGRYPRRAALLFAEGTAHFVLVFAFDVLMGYAVAALVVAWLLGRSGRAQTVAMWVAGGLHLALMLLGTAALLGTADPTSNGDPTSSGGPAASADPRLAELFSDGGYLDQLRFRLDNALALRIEPIITFGLLVFLFLLGVRLFRAGAFGADETGRRLRRRMLRIGLGAGLPLNLATTLAGPDFFLIDRYVLPPLVTIGYLGLVGTLLDRLARPGPVTAGLTAVGRTALSCYVLQNLTCAVLCYGWGFGLAATLADARPWWVFGLWAAVCTALAVAASFWLRRFPLGPLEALQKRLLGTGRA
ncbi:DUF418 domain-containing protein [Plantactinospora sp. CA-290183]|uniref:DUF418 domain-containing protein n=1 Tax=Plantactinospora sp. CA-290183 TaxID=3240006 RepID=UPI003D92465D